MTDSEQAILKEADDNLKIAMELDNENRKQALADLEFIAVPGKQWPDDIKSQRLADNRPCLEINKMPAFVDQVVGDQRMNRPSIKVLPVDNVSDPAVAKILGGWIKHVFNISQADVAIDHAFEHAVSCGYGAMRVVTKYVSDESFDQEAYVQKIENALAVYWGPHEEYDCSDAPYCFILSDMPKEIYKATYKKDGTGFTGGDSQFLARWSTKDTIRVAEYFKKEPVEYKLYLLEDGRTEKILGEQDKVLVKQERKVTGYKIVWRLLSGDGVLEERTWAGKKYIPVIPVWGKEVNVGGKRYVRGLVRNAKDSQRMYNYWQSIDTEVVALQPRVPYLVTPKQISGHEGMWQNANKMNYSYLLVNFDKDAPDWPHREAPPQASSAMIQKIAQTDQEMRDTIGLQKASLGMQSNERSGAAIRERKKEGDVGTFAFTDNLARSTAYLGRVLLDVAPGILDTQRIIRLGLDDETFEFMEINKRSEDGKIFRDMSIGHYDVRVSVGPSFTTQRTEARESMQAFIQYYPQAAPLIGDLYAKANDWPGADDVAKRLEHLLPPEIRIKNEMKQAKFEGREPELPTPPPPDPNIQLKTQEMQFRLEEQKVRLAQEKVRLKTIELKSLLELQGSQDNIKAMVENILKTRESAASPAGGNGKDYTAEAAAIEESDNV
jgi:hypothetical protein